MWMNKSTAFLLLSAAGLLWGQQAAPPAPPPQRPPTVPFTAAEVAAIPLTRRGPAHP
jgi:hypothetical protein